MVYQSSMSQPETRKYLTSWDKWVNQMKNQAEFRLIIWGNKKMQNTSCKLSEKKYQHKDLHWKMSLSVFLYFKPRRRVKMKVSALGANKKQTGDQWNCSNNSFLSAQHRHYHTGLLSHLTAAGRSTSLHTRCDSRTSCQSIYLFVSCFNIFSFRYHFNWRIALFNSKTYDANATWH